MPTLTPRERVLAAIRHEEPDRIPVDFSGHRSSGIMAIAYSRLKRHLGITTGDIYVYDFIQQLAIVEPPVLDRFSVDVVEMGRGFGLEPGYWKEWTLPDGTPCKIPAHIDVRRDGEAWRIYSADGEPIAVQPPGSLYFDQTCFPLADSADDSLAGLDRHFPRCVWFAVGSPPAPLGFDPVGLRHLRAGAEALRRETDRAIVGLFGGNLHESGQFLFGMENYLCELAASPRRIHRFLDRLTEIHMANLERFLSAVGPYVDIVVFGDDLGAQTGPQISRRTYDTFYRDRHAALWGRARELADVKVMLHCCGGVVPLLPSLIEAGLDIINPVQTTCRDMEPERLKREFGRDLVFWGGGCDTRDVLAFGSPEEVREDVRARVAALSPGGGFVFQQIHNIMADVPPQNVTAMFDAIRADHSGADPTRSRP